MKKHFGFVSGFGVALLLISTLTGCGSDSSDPPTAGTNEKTLVINALSNIFGSGHSVAPAPAGGGGGTLPDVFEFSAKAGQTVTFSSVTGNVSCCSGGTTFNGPDGGGFLVPTDLNSFDGISGLIHDTKTMFLVGVFSDGTKPSDPTPGRLNFSSADNFESISPELNQVFFIGDGLTATGSGNTQKFMPPPSATRLYLGIADGFGFQGFPGAYDDNIGEITVTLKIE